MKIIVTNLSGNAGKTTLRKHLLVPLLAGAQAISIEDQNDGDGAVHEELAAREFRRLAVRLNTALDEAHHVIDIGSSNLRESIEHLRSLRTTRELIDHWVLPFCPTIKQRNDTLATVKALVGLGVPADKIRVLLTCVDDVHTADEILAPVLDVAPKVGFHVAPVPVLFNDVYQLLKDRPATVFDLAADATDLKALARKHRGDLDKLEDIGRTMVVRDLARDACDNLREVFSGLNLTEPVEA